MQGGNKAKLCVKFCVPGGYLKKDTVVGQLLARLSNVSSSLMAFVLLTQNLVCHVCKT